MASGWRSMGLRLAGYLYRTEMALRCVMRVVVSRCRTTISTAIRKGCLAPLIPVDRSVLTIQKLPLTAMDRAALTIYISAAIASFSITNSYIHDAVVGHEVKSRAANNIITGNRIFDNNGSASYSIDMPNGGNATSAATDRAGAEHPEPGDRSLRRGGYHPPLHELHRQPQHHRQRRRGSQCAVPAGSHGDAAGVQR